ncbi:MAG: UDP-4-amino-4-deoxy-L-arabinose aminotransferase [Phycisphaerales bacterium]|nr:UDP-4-amino-4-deoxy-L-arabinose aminotransferase [Phycisphaerales bacterium]
MRKEFLPFCRPSITESDIAAVGDVLRSGWITTGPKVQELERMVAVRTGAKEAIAATSGTALMHLALTALGIGRGDEVIGPSMTWVSTPNMVELMGARNVFVDVDRETQLVSSEAIDAAITPRTRLVIPVHYAGAPCDLDAIRAVCRRRGVPILEDAAHAIGTQYKGREIGGEDTAIFSLHPIKNITSGEGGVLTTNDEALASRIRRLRFHGLAVDANDRKQQGRSPQSEVEEPGYKQNMPDMNAVLAVRQLPRLDSFIARREQIASAYKKRLAEIEGILPLADPPWPHRHARHLVVVRVDERASGIDRLAFTEGLKERNIGTGIHFLAAHTQRWYREQRPEWMGRLPNTEWNSARICTLPCFPDMTDDDVTSVVDAIKDTISQARTRVPGGRNARAGVTAP